MKMLPLISVIIPIYNAEKFIYSALDFVNGQDVELPLEIILIDNNSKDNSYQIIQKLAEQNDNIFAFRETTQGAAAARNKGLEESKGDFIYFYDVDDQLFPDTLKNLSNVLLEYKDIEAVFGKMFKSYESVLEKDRTELQESDKVIIKEKPFWGIKWFKDLSSVVGPPAFLYRRAVFDKIGNYEEKLLTGQDTALDIKLGMSCKIAQIDKFVYLYLKHSSSTTDHVKKRKSREFMQWPRITTSHLPFYLEGKANKEFGKILYKKIFSSMGKMIYQTEGYHNRVELKKKLIKNIKQIQVPSKIDKFLTLLTLFPNKYFLKLYHFHFLPKQLKNFE